MIEPFRRPNRGDHPDVPDAIWRVLEPLYEQEEKRAREARIATREYRTVEVEDGQEVEVGLQSLRASPREIRLISNDRGIEMATPLWHLAGELRIALTVFFPSSPEGKVSVTFVAETD